MENQNKKIVCEVATELMKTVVQKELCSFSVLSNQTEKSSDLCTAICGKPVELAFSLAIVMSKSPEAYRIMKTAIATFEKAQSAQFVFKDLDQTSELDPILKDFIKTIFRS